MATFEGVKSTVKSIGAQAKESLATAVKPQEKKEEVVRTQDFYTGALSRGTDNVMGQATRAEYINEFIDFWRDDYRAKAKVLCFLAIAFLTWGVFAPFSLFCVALAAKYWDHSLWCRNISRFNGNFRTISFGN